MKRRDFIKTIEAAGYNLLRHGKEHDMYGNSKGDMIAVPRHNEISKGVVRRELGRRGLI
ncbi:putative RNA binding protein YcfA (HicA-like mRNA interferase family) [Lachnospiraceae bacterium PF1-21]|uniref:type II toxin-antitoxin system HicA family toxin n=1 Tax=Ohessyouella blattaphilus TaxID=2949333 RepID=UPI003E2CEED0